MNLPFILECLLSALLAAAVVYCAVLDRRLRALRRDQGGLNRNLETLAGTIAAARASLTALQDAAGSTGQSLKRDIDAARALLGELSTMTQGGARRSEYPRGDLPQPPQQSRVIRPPKGTLGERLSVSR